MKQTRFWTGKLYRRAIQQISSRVYINPDANPRWSILVAGTARSGTTWLGDIIASQVPSRILFEPFNPDLVPEYHGFRYFQYLRRGAENPRFHAFARRVFAGEIRNHWVDRQNERIYSKYRLIKEIRINLALSWLHDNFPMVPILFLVRHPCAVVASRMDLDWATDRDIEQFLSQPDLVTDYLTPQMELIKGTRTAEEKHAIIWCICNLVPLAQFDRGALKIVYYENLCARPEAQLPAIFASMGQSYDASKKNAVNRPSQTTRVSSAVVDGTDKISSWRKRLSMSQIKKVLQIVDAFGLGDIYGDSVFPLRQDGI